MQIGVAGDGDMVNAKGLSVIIRNFNNDYGLGNSGVINQAQGYSISADLIGSIPGISANNSAEGISFYGTSLVPAITSPGDVYGFRISEHALDGGTNEFGISVEDTEALNLFMGNTAFGVADWANDSENISLKLKVQGAFKADYGNYTMGTYVESLTGQPVAGMAYLDGAELWGSFVRADSNGRMGISNVYTDFMSLGPNGLGRSTAVEVNEEYAAIRYQTENRADPAWDKQNSVQVDASGTIVWGDDGDNTSYNMQWNNDTVGGIAQLTNAGNMIIGSVDTPTDRLHVIGDVRVGTASTNGCLKDFSGGTITGTCSSDERLKTNIADVGTVLDRFTEIQLVTYDWNNLAQQRGFVGNTSQLGVLAQNVETYFPELVVTDSDGYKQVNYARLQLLSIQAIKELDIKIEAIESFASSINTTFIDSMRNWLASATNSITLIVSDTLKARNQLCIDDVCITKDQLAEMMINQGMITPEIVVDPVIETVDESEIVPEGEPESQPESEPTPEPEIVSEPVPEPAPTVPVDGETE